MRLACVKHAASVRSEPGSNSQVHHSPEPKSQTTTNEDPTQSTRSSSRQIQPAQKSIIQRKAIIPETDQRHRSHDHNQPPLRIRRQHPLFELRQSSQVTFITSPINTNPNQHPRSRRSTQRRHQHIPSIPDANVKEQISLPGSDRSERPGEALFSQEAVLLAVKPSGCKHQSAAVNGGLEEPAGPVNPLQCHGTVISARQIRASARKPA